MAELDVEALKQLTPDEIAGWFHAAYEELAPSFGYETRKASAVPWSEVPEPNRSLMIAVARAVVIEQLDLPAIIAALEDRDRLRATLSRIDAVVERMYLPPEFAHFQAELCRILTLEGRDG